jgi:antitoxin (DNA-binding transcriptional repressor) of toxin-antitoxin stability system
MGPPLQVTIHAAKTNLSKLIEVVLAGEEVVIARGKTPVVRLVAVPKHRFKFDVLKGPGPDVFEPMAEEDLALREGRD